MNLLRLLGALLSLALLALTAPASAADDKIDFDRARQLFQRQQRGETLAADDKAYLERALAERNKRPGGQGGGGGQTRPAAWTQHLTPLSELGTGKYQDQDGGLYGGGSNVPPKAHLDAAMKEAAQIRPLDADGQPSDTGTIGLMSVGMSNVTQEFSTFVRQANGDAEKSPHVVLIDCAQGGQTGTRWANPAAPLWTETDRRLAAARVAAKQVQVVWLKQAEAGPASLGAFPKHALLLKDNLVKCLALLHERFPNLRLVYVSSRIYAGYATTSLNPEPYAYETAFSMRWLIQDQIAGKPELNYDPAKGAVKSPLVLWGPYLWTDGQTARKSDGLTYAPEDLGPDGTHPSNSGREKVSAQLLKFFKTDATAKTWFLKAK